ncbi:MAG: RNA polymerase sigma factor [Kyrpidia tusciae]|nr:RNA polymerase sigma factor [Kyrpidia tusciae]MBE3553380.1 RNA polymerase sigma factor [Kyrpidia tusciae]
MESDEALARAFAEGHTGSFEALVYRYHRPIHAYIQRLLGRTEPAEDLVQETFFRFVREVQRGRVPERVRPWLYRVATNLCRDYWKAAQRRSEPGLLEDWSPAVLEKPSVSEIYERLETRQMIRDALDELSEIQKRMVILRFYQDLTYREIAEVLEVPEGTVKAYLFKALRHLREVFEQREPMGKGGEGIAARAISRR